MTPAKKSRKPLRKKRKRERPSILEGQHIVYKDKRGRYTEFRRNKMLSVWVFDKKGKLVRQIFPLSRLGKRVGTIDPLTDIERPLRAYEYMPKRAKKGWEPVERIMSEMYLQDKAFADLKDMEMPMFVPPKVSRYGKLMRVRRYVEELDSMEKRPIYLFADDPVRLNVRVNRVWCSTLVAYYYPDKRFLIKRNFYLEFKHPLLLRYLFTSQGYRRLEGGLDAVVAEQIGQREIRWDIVNVQGISV